MAPEAPPKMTTSSIKGTSRYAETPYNSNSDDTDKLKRQVRSVSNNNGIKKLERKMSRIENNSRFIQEYLHKSKNDNDKVMKILID